MHESIILSKVHEMLKDDDNTLIRMREAKAAECGYIETGKDKRTHTHHQLHNHVACFLCDF